MINYENIIKNYNDFIIEHLLPIIKDHSEKYNEDLENNIYENIDKNNNIQKNIIFLSNLPDVENVLDIGFHSGFSTLLFLMSNSKIKVTAIDIVKYSYVIPCYLKIKSYFKDRITLIWGNSIEELKNININMNFDICNIDGSSDKEITKIDIKNSLLLLKNNGCIILNDDIKNYIDNDLVHQNSTHQNSTHQIAGAFSLRKTPDSAMKIILDNFIDFFNNDYINNLIIFDDVINLFDSNFENNNQSNIKKIYLYKNRNNNNWQISEEIQAPSDSRNSIVSEDSWMACSGSGEKSLRIIQRIPGGLAPEVDPLDGRSEGSSGACVRLPEETIGNQIDILNLIGNLSFNNNLINDSSYLSSGDTGIMILQKTPFNIWDDLNPNTNVSEKNSLIISADPWRDCPGSGDAGCVKSEGFSRVGSLRKTPSEDSVQRSSETIDIINTPNISDDLMRTFSEKDLVLKNGLLHKLHYPSNQHPTQSLSGSTEHIIEKEYIIQEESNNNDQISFESSDEFPKGSWKNSCRNYYIEDDYLNTEIKNCDGTWNYISLKIFKNIAYDNNNGILEPIKIFINLENKLSICFRIISSIFIISKYYGYKPYIDYNSLQNLDKKNKTVLYYLFYQYCKKFFGSNYLKLNYKEYVKNDQSGFPEITNNNNNFHLINEGRFSYFPESSFGIVNNIYSIIPGNMSEKDYIKEKIQFYKNIVYPNFLIDNISSFISIHNLNRYIGVDLTDITYSESLLKIYLNKIFEIRKNNSKIIIFTNNNEIKDKLLEDKNIITPNNCSDQTYQNLYEMILLSKTSLIIGSPFSVFSYESAFLQGTDIELYENEKWTLYNISDVKKI